ncbi:PLD nuclease N-terminal domain-containing protein [Frigoribacterium sp. VKM Ac-2836]|uniref:PLD nuclease N-terminal domain-containing protein n=1 Tax=Frigoribacterium sp. VKM Ac-2836 TaxID=2739014 RepID=UPI001566AF24|nr:PLD nuclease N-terminal domain-containing protein [Frigoribacterium sp. VKM Ac-2836]NRD25249.1 PLDc_N domain-containing protein [Frigoribacterium sp. VKM Ac-2836]
MVRLFIVGIVAAAAFVIFALIDCLFADTSRFRALNKPLWAVIIVLLPVIGAVLWFMLGRARKNGRPVATRTVAPDDDPEFSGSSWRTTSDLDQETTDERIRRLEQELLDLDNDDKTGKQ